MSMTSAPPASGTSSRCLVAWRPRSSPRPDGERRPLLPGEAVEQRRLADAGGAEQDGGAPGREPGAQRVHPGAVDDAHREDGHRAAERGAHLGHAQRGLRVQIGLGEHDHGLGLRVGGEGEEALEPAQVEVAVERADHERHVDVRGEHLRLGAPVARGTGDPAAAGQKRVDDARLRVGADPVAHRGQVGGGGGGVAQAAGRRAGERAVRGHEVEPPAVCRGHAGGDQVRPAQRREGGVEGGGPAEDGERAVRMKR